MTTGPQDELYIVDGPLSGSSLPTPKIMRPKFDPANAAQVIEQVVWVDSGLEFPNGITRIGRFLYVTNGSLAAIAPGQVLEIEILDNGLPGAPRLVGMGTGILDDLSAVGDHLLV